MSGTSVINAVIRKTKGGGAMGRLRKSGLIPANLYGAGTPGALLEINEHDFVQMMKHHASEHLIADLSIDGQETVKALVKEVQHHPVSGQMLHIDFQAISMSEKIRITLPVELCGEPVGVVQQGGTLEHLMREVEIECMPGDLMEVLELDVSSLSIGDRLLARDIPLDPAKYVLVTEPQIAVASVVPPRVQATAAADGEEKAAAGEAK